MTKTQVNMASATVQTCVDCERPYRAIRPESFAAALANPHIMIACECSEDDHSVRTWEEFRADQWSLAENEVVFLGEDGLVYVAETR